MTRLFNLSRHAWDSFSAQRRDEMYVCRYLTYPYVGEGTYVLLYVCTDMYILYI